MISTSKVSQTGFFIRSPMILLFRKYSSLCSCLYLFAIPVDIHIRLSIYVLVNEKASERRTTAALQDIGRSDPVAVTESARLRRNVCLRIERHTSLGSAEGVTTSRPAEAGRPGRCAPQRQVDALSLGAARRSARAARPRRVAPMDGERPSHEWRTPPAQKSLLPN